MRAKLRGLAAWLSLASVALVACSHGGKPAAHVLRIAYGIDPNSLNTVLARDQGAAAIDLLVNQTLIGLSDSNRLSPVLVTRVPSTANGDVSADGKTIVYHLRRGVRFADGVQLTSIDVAFTFHALLDSRNPVLSTDTYRRVSSLQTPDPFTVVVRLKHRWNAAVSELFAESDSAYGILPAHAFKSFDLRQAGFNSRPFGTGPFHVVQWRRGDRIVLRPNPFFRPRPRLRRIDILMMPGVRDVQAPLLALQANDVDIVTIGWHQVPAARRIDDARIVLTPTNQVTYLLLQVAAVPTNDVRVRRAIAASIDKQWMLLGTFGKFKPGDSFLSPLFPWHDPSPRSIVANPSRVANQLGLAGWKIKGGWWTKNGSPLSLTIVTSGATPLIAQEALRRAGFLTDVKVIAPALFNAPDGPVRRGRFNVVLDSWIGGSDPEQSVIFACSQRGPNGSNRSNYCNRRFEAAYYDQAVTTDVSKRRSDFIQMQRIIRDDVPAVPLAFVATIDVVSNRVTGFRRNMLALPVGAETWDAR